MEHWLWIILAALFFGLIAGDKISPVGDKVSKREGESVTLTCDYETTDTYIRLYWYRHHSDLQTPQFILWKGARSRSSENYIPDYRYGSQTSQTSTALTITGLTLADTALYYCALRVGWPFGVVSHALIFGKPIQLTVTPKDLATKKPDLFVLSPLQPDGVSVEDLADEVCLVTNLPTKDGEMGLNVRERQVSVNTSNAVLSEKDKSYVYAGFINETIYSCELHNMSANNYNVDLCADLNPEKAKLNFDLLIMNWVRVVFTKALAFSTILTIRAVLF